jgi:cytochrome b
LANLGIWKGRQMTGIDPTSKSEARPADLPKTVPVWDLPLRLFHWALAATVLLAWVSRSYGDGALVWHTWNGYAVLVLVVWRLLWGFVGSSTARFGSFIYWPQVAIRYAMDFAMRRPRPFLGHNPLGGLVVIAMLGVIGAQAILGLFSYDDHDALTGGPLSAKVSEAVWNTATRLHHQLFDVILAIVALHVAANILYIVWKGENLVHAMITGRKPAQAFEDAPQADLAGAGRALLCLMLAIAIVFGGIWAAGGKVL